MPPSQLDGREPAAVTEYEHDADGRLVRAVTIREPRYTEQDFAELIALDRYRSTLCPLHGGPLDECGTEAADGTFEVPPPIRCRAHELTLIHKAAHKADHPDALLWTVLKKKRR